MAQTSKTQNASGTVAGRSAKSTCKYLRIAPRKVRPVINTIRHHHPQQAMHILSSINKKAARMAEKVLKSVMANAKVLGLDETRLTISDIRADGGPVMKRLMERSMGRADRMVKRMTHLSIVLSEGQRKFNTTSTVQAQAAEKESPKAAKEKKKTAAAKV